MFNLENLNDEYFAKLDPQEVLGVKELSVEDKIKCFRYFLTSEGLVNTSIISNIYFIINGLTDISDDVFNDNRIFFNSLDEYVDIKLAIKEDLDKFKIKLLEHYLGVIVGLDIKLNELKIHLPNIYFNILNLCSITLISKLMANYISEINVNNIKPIANAESIYAKINSPSNIMLNFIQAIIPEVINK